MTHNLRLYNSSEMVGIQGLPGVGDAAGANSLAGDTVLCLPRSQKESKDELYRNQSPPNVGDWARFVANEAMKKSRPGYGAAST